ncbi:preprotein translocase subunit Sec61beta [Candidatus Woesearchaeota archaeon]|nr:preprotein translocase subunit Sec61beta [Candidatus Woesearchaeota archaeon]
MPQDQKMMLPSSQGGLVRYYDEYKSRIQIKPSHVIVLAVAIIAIEVFLHNFG